MLRASGQILPGIAASHFPDRWIALSSLQKSIRRGAAEHAVAATEALWSEPSRLLDRLLVIGLEDIGVGDLDVLREVIELTTDRNWRRSLPDKGKRATLGLVERMCAATKSRFSDELLAIAALEPALSPARKDLMVASDKQLMDCIASDSDIGSRAVATWCLAGTVRYPMDGAPRRQGTLAAVWEAAGALGVPVEFLDLLDRAARRMRWPLAILLPLAYVSKAGGAPTQLLKDILSETYRGIPLNALDQFTRRGRAAIASWVAGCPELQAILQKAAPSAAWLRITRYMVFAVEGQDCSRYLMWPEQRDILRRSMLAELTGPGLVAAFMDPLLACATANLDALNECRRHVIDEVAA